MYIAKEKKREEEREKNVYSSPTFFLETLQSLVALRLNPLF